MQDIIQNKNTHVQKVNYQKELEKIIDRHVKAGEVPELLLHSCCAPCSSYCLEYLSQFFSVTIFYYNPNIYPEDEYERRVEEQKRLISELPAKHPIHFIAGEFDPSVFYEMAKGLEDVPEGGERCFKCYELRLREAGIIARSLDFDYFTTTLSISPLKNSAKLNEIGLKLEKELGVSYLVSDFKKKNGYKRSTEMSREYNLYRQDYCGCVFSYKERQAQKSSLLPESKS